MNLAESAKEYIELMGRDAAAIKFNKSKPTVQSWLSANNFPTYVIQAMMDENGIPIKPDLDQTWEQMERQDSEDIETLKAEVDLIFQHIEHINDYLSNLAIPQRVVARPVPPPRVISADPLSTSGVEGASFRPLARLGGNKPNELPPPTPKRFGKTMASLLQPMRPLKRDR